MSNQNEQKTVGRRTFLRTAGVGAAAAAATTVAGAPAKVEAAENAETRKKARYRETDHVKKFYDICRM
jgi:nitrous oxide reductase